MPCMSRSIAPASAIEDVDGKKLAGQVANLLQELEIDVATIYGCSSGGAASLSLAIYHPEITRNIVIHEVPLGKNGSLKRDDGYFDHMAALPDEALKKVCGGLFRTMMIEDPAAWDAMGSGYLGRLEVNYPLWVRKYGAGFEADYTKGDLTKRPIDWTIGAKTEAEHFVKNVVLATKAGLPIGVLPCKYFPQITVPDILAKHIMDATRKYL